MKILTDFHQYHMKIDTSSERLWISFEDEQVSNKLLFFGKHCWTSLNVMLPHVHASYEFIYIIGGEGSIFSRGIEYKLSSGDILVMEPNKEHEGVANPENPFELFFMGYDFKKESSEFNQAIQGLDRIFLKVYEIYVKRDQLPIIQGQHRIGQLLFNVLDEINDTKLYREELIRTYLNEIFVLLVRKVAEFIEIKEVGLDENESVKKAEELINARFYEPLTMEKIAGYVCLSPSHFSRLFKSKKKFTPIEYLHSVRIENAKKLLIYSGLTLTEISNRVGFNSIHYFSYYFKKKEGVGPLEYRREKKKLFCL